jgi:transposase
MDRASLEQLLGQGLSLAEIGRRFGRHEATVSYWVKKYGLEATNHSKHVAKGGLARDELTPLVEAGMSIAEIAEEVERSKATVRHWLREYGLKTKRSEERRVALQTQRQVGEVLMRECMHHGVTEFKRRSTGGHRCLKCRSDAVTKRRRKVKQTLVDEAGGACHICGYDRCIAALEFHHLEPSEKRFALSHRSARSLASSRAEADKCMLLCANCHAEVEAGLVSLASDVAVGVECSAHSGSSPG